MKQPTVQHRRAEHVVQGRRYRAIFHIGTGRCLSLKQLITGGHGEGHWRQADMRGPKGEAAIEFLRKHGEDWRT